MIRSSSKFYRNLSAILSLCLYRLGLSSHGFNRGMIALKIIDIAKNNIYKYAIILA
jgi:hypothetical protein